MRDVCNYPIFVSGERAREGYLVSTVYILYVYKMKMKQLQELVLVLVLVLLDVFVLLCYPKML